MDDDWSFWRAWVNLSALARVYAIGLAVVVWLALSMLIGFTSLGLAFGAAVIGVIILGVIERAIARRFGKRDTN